MKKFFTLSFFLMLLLLFSNSVTAQFRLGLGPDLAFNFNLHNGSDLDEGGSGFGIAFSGIVDMTFTQDRSIGVLTRLGFYDNRSGGFSVTGQIQQGVNATQDTDISLAYFIFEPLFKYRLPSGLYFVFGPSLGFNISAEREDETTITTPGYTFQGGSTTQKAKQTIKNTSVRFELKTGTGYDIPLSPLITLTPQFTFGFGLTNVIEDVSYKVMTFQLGVACKFNLI